MNKIWYGKFDGVVTAFIFGTEDDKGKFMIGDIVSGAFYIAGAGRRYKGGDA